MIDAATILVADDSSDDVELFKRALHKAGINNPVEHVSDGQELIDYLQGLSEPFTNAPGCPLLVFLDLNMPRCKGFAVLEWLQRQPELRDLPIIVFSNSDQTSDMDKASRLGANGYWVKPSRFEDLLQMMLDLKAVLARISDKLELQAPTPVSA